MQANKLLVLVIAAAAGCSGVSQPGSATGDDGGSGSDMGSDMGSNGAPDQLHGSVLDERNDSIDFSSGEPLHVHGGSPVALSETGCADVYKYAYLMSATPPMYGHESAPNPLVWMVTNADADPSKTSYRVRDEANQVLLDWTSIPPDANGQYAIALYRDGAHGVAALGTTGGTMHLDVRFHDAHGAESQRSSCWTNHPLAAPLLVSAPQNADLFGMSLPSSSPISHVMSTPGVSYATFELTQETAEPIALKLSAPPPTGSVTRLEVDTWVNIGAADAGGACSDPFSDACEHPVHPTSSSSATSPLSAAWTLQIIDESDGSTLCTASDLDLTCTIPARPANQLAHHYRGQVVLGGIESLAVGTDVNNEYGAGAWGTYTGTAPGAMEYHCDLVKPHLDAYFCAKASYRLHILALDRATVAVGGLALSLVTYSGSSGVAPSYLPSTALSIPAQTWDAGDKGLPLN